VASRVTQILLCIMPKWVALPLLCQLRQLLLHPHRGLVGMPMRLSDAL
jgi:hypothetical protein